MNKKLKKTIYVLLITILIFFVSYIWLWKILYTFDKDFLYNIKVLTKDHVHKDIIVVEVDDITHNKLWFPFDRQAYVTFLNNLEKAKPAVIWFDIFFADKSQNTKSDIALWKKFTQMWNIVNGIWIQKNTAMLPYTPFTKGVDLWFFKPKIDPKALKVYSVEPFLKPKSESWKYFESFSFAVLRKYYNILFWENNNTIDNSIINHKYNFFTEYRKTWVPLNENNEFVINFINPKAFKKESFYNIYSGNFNALDFKDKIVLIWATAQGIPDDFTIPYYWIIKWVYIHANVINNLLENNYVLFLNQNIEYLIWFLFILLLVYINIFHLQNFKITWISLGSVFLFIIIFFLYLILFISVYNTTWIYIVPNNPYEFVIILFLSFFASSITKFLIEDKNKALLSKALSEYVSADVAREILTSSWKINLNWENKRITMFFSDIAGFTTISEKMSPEELVSFLKIYLWEMSNIILDKRWFINKYEWDAIMALWWVFGHAERYWVLDACESCLLQQKTLKALNEKWIAEWQHTLSVRMWIHTWPAIIWNIWATWRKMEFTALWDNVNLASRLEWVNKYYKTNICASEDIYNDAKDLYTFRYLDEIKVKWKDNAIKIYELISRIWEESDFQKDIISKFEKAISLYQEQNFIQALEIFKQLELLWDAPSWVYLERCEKFMHSNDGFNWITTMEEK